MLKNQDADHAAPSSAPASAGPPRVTPGELNQALAAIEARRQAEAAHLAGTIPIDQAVSDLHLDSTSDEIWAEVQAQRAGTAAKQKPPRQTPQAVQSPAAAQRKQARSVWLGILPPILIGWVLIQANVIPHFWSHPTHAAPPVLRPLAQEPDGREVYADDAALVQISEGKPASQITISENATGNRWPLVKMRGHTYLHGYIASTDSLQPLQGKALNVYNDDNSGELDGESTSNITLRVDDVPLQKSSGDSDFSGITVPDFQPDPLTTLSPWH